MTSSQVEADWIDITPALRGYLARPVGDSRHPAILVFIEAFGVNDHFQSLARRLAKAGYVALVPDLYHGKTYEYSDVENAIGHLRTLKDDQVMRETGSALDLLAKHQSVDGNRPGVLGFCMGGRYAFMTGGEKPKQIGSVVSYYGGGIAPLKDSMGRTPLLTLIPAIEAPLLLHYGTEDKAIAPDEHARIVEALSQAGKRYTLQVYPEAGHGFFCEQRTSYHAASAEESWALTLDFFTRHFKE